MALTIWKQELNWYKTRQSFVLPKDAHILRVALQGDRPHIWFTCDPESKMQQARHFRIVGTGHPEVPDPKSSKYLGTVDIALPSGMLVLHIFETEEP